MNIRQIFVIFLGVLISIHLSGVLYAGQLDDFEKAATEKKETPDKKKKKDIN